MFRKWFSHCGKITDNFPCIHPVRGRQMFETLIFQECFIFLKNVTENFFNHQQWWKEMKKQMNPSKSTSAKSKAGTNYTKTYKLNCQFIKSHQRQSRNWNWHWNQLSDLVILAISICRYSRQKWFTFSNIPLLF